MMEWRQLEFYKHLLFCWGMPSKTLGSWSTGKLDYSWGSVSTIIEVVTDTHYQKQFRPEEWLMLDRYLMSINFR